jgi:D-serine deaminase-like pyridoxal phosphate-dependent protein
LELNKYELDTPALVVDLDVMEKNIQAMADIAKRMGLGIIPHAKAHKVVEIARAQVAAGADGVAVAKIGEGEVMVEGGLGKLLLTTPPMGQPKMDRLRSLARRAEIAVVIDSLTVAQHLSHAFSQEAKAIGVFIEVDTGLGRCGLLPGEPVVDLAQNVVRLPGLAFQGLKTAALQVYNQKTVEGISQVEQKACQQMIDTATLLKRKGINVSALLVGSTPSVWGAAFPKGITHVQPGSYVLNSLDGVATGGVTLQQCALTVIATVISRPARDRAVIDAGFKALSLVIVPGIPGYGRILGMNEAVVERLYEEHGVVRIVADHPLQIGDKVEIIPNSCSAITNQFDELVAIRHGVVETIWSIQARGRYT